MLQSMLLLHLAEAFLWGVTHSLMEGGGCGVFLEERGDGERVSCARTTTAVLHVDVDMDTAAAAALQSQTDDTCG